MKIIRKILTKLLYSCIDTEYLSSLKEEQRNKIKLSQVTMKGQSYFYPESEVINLANNPSLIRIGINTHIRGELLIFKSSGQIEIGGGVFIGAGSKIWSGEKVFIGDHVLISHNVFISDTTSHELDHLERANSFLNIVKNGHPETKGSIKTAVVTIEDYAWINPNATIIRGVRIGKGAIVAAGSVVTRDVLPFTLVAGNPANLIKDLR